MRRIINTIILLVTLSGCNSFLETVPDSRLELDNLDKIAELVTNAYPDGGYLFLEWMTDNVGPVPENRQQRYMSQAYRWEDVDYEYQDSPTFYWNRAYLAIAHANEALKALDNISTSDLQKKNAVRAEALLCRAYAHFMLVNIFAKQYNKQTAASDLGVPYVREPETTLIVDYKRNTIKEVYDFAEQDLLEGLKYLTGDYYKNSGKYHFTPKAAIAFASRFYLFKGEYEESLKYSDRFFDNQAYNKKYIKNLVEVNKVGSDIVVANEFTKVSDESNLLLIRKETEYQYDLSVGNRMNPSIYYGLRFIGGDGRYINDARLEAYAGNDAQSAIYIPKYPWLIRVLSLTSGVGLPYTVHVVLRGEEVLFNRLEAYVYLNQTGQIRAAFAPYVADRYNGVIDYDGLYNFYKVNMPGKSEREVLLAMILDEKRKEFIEEGFRWFDIKRYHMSVTHTDVDGSVYVLKADDLKTALQIPSAPQSHGIEPNERAVITKTTGRLNGNVAGYPCLLPSSKVRLLD